ncbi:MAG: C40 family peptidase [Sulfuricurvum sp.]|uniref:C40 family peptidase n=1 Tax=Sulfuricurvum sp. TaxID=2025608 RepID=UPI0025D68F1E|nr:C40 family peptidase [Sulfuricurvum sp.]MBV5320991.1 C40 family peptidase [Sulfuricurvum sp.]
MLIKRTVLSLILLTIASQADTSRREPSLFLEYEREVKKANDSLREDDPFLKNTSSISKSILTSDTIKPVTLTEPVPVKVLKNTKVDVDKIGEDNKAFLVVNKPAPIASASLCPDEVKVDATPKSTPQKIVKSFKNAKVKVLTRAKEFLGTPYGFGDKDGDRTDCSGFTQQVYKSFGVSLPHSATEQALLGENVSLNDLQIGDLMFYRTYKSDPSHVAIYAGNGKIIHASYAARKVQYDSIEKGYYRDRFMYARRLSFSNPDYDE